MLPRLDLAEHLHDDRCLAAAGVSDDLEVLVLGALRYAQKASALVHFDSDPDSLDGLIELFRRDQNRPFKTPAILHFFPTSNVLGNGPRKLKKEEDSPQNKLKSERARKSLAVEDLLAQISL